MNDDLLYKIAMTKISGVGAVTARTLISYCGGVEAVFKSSKKALLKIPKIGEGTVGKIFDPKILPEAEAELKFIEKEGIQCFFYLDKNYPSRLKTFNDAPILLYFKGTTDLNHFRTVGIIGTRKATERGKAMCEEIVEGLKPYNPLIISGLAYGIDVTAHRKSIDLGMETIGILGHGLNRVYPNAHRQVAEKMMDNGGLLTEFASTDTFHPDNFPARNRIIAGLCDAVVVVETARSGGSVITANFAFDYNKDIFAVPGRVKDKLSEGCNRLIKIHKANLMESAEDIAYIMRWEEAQKTKTIQRQLFVELSPDEQKIIDLLKTNESIDVDTLGYKTQFSPSQLSAHLLGLEFKGMIKVLPGKRYMLC